MMALPLDAWLFRAVPGMLSDSHRGHGPVKRSRRKPKPPSAIKQRQKQLLQSLLSAPVTQLQL